jgi:hypothetical protein
MRFLFNGLLAISLLHFFAHSENASATAGPPLVTDDPGTPGPNKFEINLAYTLEDSSTEKRIELPLLDVNFGVGENIQLKYEVPYVISKNQELDTKHSGFDRSAAGVKWRFHDKSKGDDHEQAEGTEKVEGGERGSVALSTYPQYSFKSPVAESARNVDAPTTHEFFLPVEAEETSGKWDFNQELGYRWLEMDTSQLAAGVVLTYNIKDETAAVLGEVHAQVPVNFHDSEILANVGTILAVTKTANFLFSVGKTFTEFGSDPNKTLLYAAVQLHI